MQELEMLDTFELQDIYSTHLGALEDAGDGLMRVVRCVKKKGVLVPVISIVMPALGALQDCHKFREMAHRIVRGEMSAH